MSTCKKCLENYLPSSHYQKYCVECAPIIAREYANEWRKRWRKNNLEKAREQDRRYRIKHSAERLKYNKEYYIKHKGTDIYKNRIRRWWMKNRHKKGEYNKKYYQLHKTELAIKRRGYFKQWRKLNREERNAWVRTKVKRGAKYHLDRVISKAIWAALKERKAGRRWETLVGYSLERLVERLEKQFTAGMSWGNFGAYWHIDHKKPKSWFGRSRHDFKKCWSLENLQPLERYKNLSKHNRYAD